MTRLLDVADDDRDRLVAELRSAAAETGALRSAVGPTLTGSRNGGDILVHLRFSEEGGWRCAADRFDALLASPTVTRVNGAAYRGEPRRSGDTAGTVYRTLLLRVHPDTDEETVTRFEHELSSMPLYVSTIRAWQLSRVVEPVGDARWTHVFEQEFSDAEGLLGPYLMHPIHWAVIDRWFDPETTDVIVHDRICHSFCSVEHPVLS
ncbi:stress responsive protein [Mycobacterium sp. 852002-51163_SCH5372311]|nr:stress responsive protein [Mycobacterium sp. 852002-51163_SCH5372311]